MFSGIIQGLGRFNEHSIITDLNLSDCKTGSSISCDGICLTVTKIKKKGTKYLFDIDLGEETLQKTTAKYWNNSKLINIEKSLKLGDEISGHFVYGHVDTTSKIDNIKKMDFSWNFYFSTNKFNNNQKKFLVEKGAISINGISLTIAAVSDNETNFCISIIPHTFNVTNLSTLNEGDLVNIEFDSLARYVLKSNG